MFLLRVWIGLTFFSFSFLICLFLSTHCRCEGLLLYLTTLSSRHAPGRDPLDEGSAHCIDLYLSTHTTHMRQIPMFPAGFVPEIPKYERLQIRALGRAATVGLTTTCSLKTETLITPHQTRLIQHEIRLTQSC